MRCFQKFSADPPERAGSIQPSARPGTVRWSMQLGSLVSPARGPVRDGILAGGVPQNSRGFTLIELLLAMALLTMLVTALLTFVFSMGEIWGRGGDKRLFEQHVNAVTRHIESLLQHAAWPRPGTTDEPFAIGEV